MDGAAECLIRWQQVYRLPLGNSFPCAVSSQNEISASAGESGDHFPCDPKFTQYFFRNTHLSRGHDKMNRGMLQVPAIRYDAIVFIDVFGLVFYAVIKKMSLILRREKKTVQCTRLSADFMQSKLDKKTYISNPQAFKLSLLWQESIYFIHFLMVRVRPYSGCWRSITTVVWLHECVTTGQCDLIPVLHCTKITRTWSYPTTGIVSRH